MQSESIIDGSDKFYWHRYSEVYDFSLKKDGSVTSILEFGVLEGDSIRFLKDRYPRADIYGADILPQLDSWPRGPNINYLRVDQASRAQVRDMLDSIDSTFDLVIEDGSHVPEHQWNCIIETLPQINRDGVYIVEDIHTAHGELARNLKSIRSSGFETSLWGSMKSRIYEKKTSLRKIRKSNTLTVLLSIAHAIDLGRQLTDSQIQYVASRSKYLSTKDIRYVESQIDHVKFFRRASLPLSCWKCKNSDFDYCTMRCSCGTAIYNAFDSMTAVIYLR